MDMNKFVVRIDEFTGDAPLVIAALGLFVAGATVAWAAVWIGAAMLRRLIVIAMALAEAIIVAAAGFTAAVAAGALAAVLLLGG